VSYLNIPFMCALRTALGEAEGFRNQGKAKLGLDWAGLGNTRIFTSRRRICMSGTGQTESEYSKQTHRRRTNEMYCMCLHFWQQTTSSKSRSRLTVSYIGYLRYTSIQIAPLKFPSQDRGTFCQSCVWLGRIYGHVRYVYIELPSAMLKVYLL